MFFFLSGIWGGFGANVVGVCSVKGERKVVIEDGKVLIEVGEEIWRVWREYEARAGEEDKEGKGEVVEEHEGGKNQGGF